MRLYNIRNGELEVVIQRGETSTITTRPRTSWKTKEIKADYAPPVIIEDKPTKSSSWSAWSARALLISGGIAAMGNIPVYSSAHVALDEQADPNLRKHYLSKSLRLPASPANSYIGYSQQLDLNLDIGKSNWKHYTLKNKDTAELGFIYLGVSKSLYKELLNDTTTKHVFDSAESGATVFAQYQGNEVNKLLYMKPNKEVFVIAKKEAGYQATWDKHAIESVKKHTAFSIKNSLNYDASKAGISRNIAREIRTALKSDINFKRDVRVGHKVTTIYEDLVFEGERIKSTNLLAVEYSTKKANYQRIRFKLADGKTHYLTPDGDTQLKRSLFSRRPLNARISSHFNPNRRHPIFKTRRAHTGTDYAAPRGTPIKATGDGKVHFLGRKGGYGKTVVIRHSGSIKTLYAHMSRYKSDLKSGDQVSKGDVIGYVGSTGNSTGNHVHYEFIVAGAYKNPEKVKLPTAGIMTKNEQTVFRNVASALIAQMDTAKRLAEVDIDVNRQNGG